MFKENENCCFNKYRKPAFLAQLCCAIVFIHVFVYCISMIHNTHGEHYTIWAYWALIIKYIASPAPYYTTNSPFASTQARYGDPRQGGAVSVAPIWHACIAIRPTKHRLLYNKYIFILHIFLSEKLLATKSWNI